MLNWNAELQAVLTRALRKDAGLFSQLQEAVGRGFFVEGRTNEHTAGGILGELGEDPERLTVLIGMLRDAGADGELLGQIEAAMHASVEEPAEIPAKPTEGAVTTNSTVIAGDVEAGAVVGAEAQGAHSQRAGRDLTIIEKQIIYQTTARDGGQVGAIGEGAEGRINNGPHPIETPLLTGLLHHGTLKLSANPADRLPSQLLQAAYEVVPFVDRPELGEIAAWCATDAAWSVRLFTGEGGSGKTRLLIEACKRQRSAGWAAGFLWGSEELPDDAIDRILNTDTERLVVLDYAETRRPFLTSLLKRAITGQAQGRLRIALLARNAGDWWAELKRTNAHITHHLTGAHHRLTALFTTPEERPARFVAAVKAMAEAQGKPFPGAPAHDGLRDAVLGQPLYLWMAALLALQGKQLSTKKDLLDETLAHEQRFWLRRLGEKGWALELGELEEWVGPVVAGVTLLSGVQDWKEAARVVKTIRSIPKKWRKKHQRKILKLLRDLYPGQVDNWLTGLQPDVLGEHLIAQHLSEELVVAMLAETFDGVSSVLTILTRLANRDEHERKWLKIVFADPERLSRCVSIAMEVAIETGDPIGMVLADQLKETPLEKRLDELYTACPEQTVALMEVASVLSQQRLALTPAPKTSASKQEILSAELAILQERSARLTDHGIRLSQTGEREEALKCSIEALDIARQFAEASPETYLPNLAIALTNMGAMLSNLGRREKALETTNESVIIHRALAKAKPDEFYPDLAMALNNMGLMLSDLGRREEALNTTKEAADAYRSLAKTRPDTFLPKLAITLNNMGAMLRDLGRREEALETSIESVIIHRALAEFKPDTFLPDLAMALTNMGPTMNDLGRKEEALNAIKEAAATYRSLTKTRPDTFLPKLAIALTNMGPIMSDLGRKEESIQVIKEAVEIRRSLVKTRPSAFLPKLAIALNNLGNILSRWGYREEALKAAKESVEIYRTLVKARPDAFFPELSRTLNLLGDRLRESNQPSPAWSAYTEAVQLLSPYFLKLPQAFAQQMKWTVHDYIQHAPPDQQPDPALIDPINAKLQELGLIE